jgi:hypothetical protein
MTAGRSERISTSVESHASSPISEARPVVTAPQQPVHACHEHGIYYGNDNWDAECCICCDNPCGAVDVERMRLHRLWDLHQADNYLKYVIDNGGKVPDAPF